MGVESSDMRTKINILMVVVQAIFFVRDTNLVRVSLITNDLQREHAAGYEEMMAEGRGSSGISPG